MAEQEEHHEYGDQPDPEEGRARRIADTPCLEQDAADQHLDGDDRDQRDRAEAATGADSADGVAAHGGEPAQEHGHDAAHDAGHDRGRGRRDLREAEGVEAVGILKDLRFQRLRRNGRGKAVGFYRMTNSPDLFLRPAE